MTFAECLLSARFLSSVPGWVCYIADSEHRFQSKKFTWEVI